MNLETKATISPERYQKNIDFWEQAWSRVKHASTKIPESMEFIPTIPLAFEKYNAKKILDIACGSGWLSFYLAEHGFEAVGADISPSAIRLANDLLEGEMKEVKNVSFVCEDMMNLSFSENYFDGILINAALEHLNYQKAKEFFSKIKYFLKPNAVMFGVFDKVATGAKGEFEVLEDGTHQYYDAMREGMLLRNYTDEELEELFKATNWEVDSIEKNTYESRIVLARNIK